MDQRESVVFIGTQFSNLYTAVDTPVNVQIFYDNLKELQVLESKRNAIRKGLVYKLLNAQDTVLCSYFAQRSGERSDCQNLGGVADEVFQGCERECVVYWYSIQ